MKYTIYSALPGRKCDALGRPLTDGKAFPQEAFWPIPPNEIIELVGGVLDQPELVIRWKGEYYNVEKRYFNAADKDLLE